MEKLSKEDRRKKKQIQSRATLPGTRAEQGTVNIEYRLDQSSDP